MPTNGVLIYFGYPQAHEDDAERAVRAGLALVVAVYELNGTNSRNAAMRGQRPKFWRNRATEVRVRLAND
jgi:hypothetical protein